AASGSARPEAGRLELVPNRFRAIASDMGERLRRTAISTNIKERLDFSCAILDAAGEMVVNAPHIPVHLGALGLCVRRLRETLPLGPGDVAVTNHPAFGGSHLPDVTVVTPVFGAGAPNAAAAEALRGVAGEDGAATVARYMEALKDLAGSSIREALREVPPGRYAAEESLDDGTVLRVLLTLKDGRAAIDFTGSAGV